MKREDWTRRVAEAEQWLEYYLNGYDRGEEVGASADGQERRIAAAAQWAAILTALKGMEPAG